MLIAMPLYVLHRDDGTSCTECPLTSYRAAICSVMTEGNRYLMKTRDSDTSDMKEGDNLMSAVLNSPPYA